MENKICLEITIWLRNVALLIFCNEFSTFLQYTVYTVQNYTYAIHYMYSHIIIDDRIEKSIKGRQIRHCVFATRIFKVQRLLKYWPGRPSDHPHSPRPARHGVHMWSVGALCVNLLFAKTFFIAAILLWEKDNVGFVLFYSVIYNSVYTVLYTVCTLHVQYAV